MAGFTLSISVKINSCLLIMSGSVQSVLKQRSQLQKETAGIELTLPRHMWIMDHFHSKSHAFAQVRGYRAGVEESADVKLSME